jgi:hypothetical protein
MRVPKAMIQRSINTEVTPMWTWERYAARSEMGMPGMGTTSVPFPAIGPNGAPVTVGSAAAVGLDMVEVVATLGVKE